MISESVIKRLRQAREQAGVTLAQVAEITGYALTTLSSVENGHDQPSGRLLDKWTQALHVSRSWLANGEGEPFASKDPTTTTAAQDLAAPIRSRIQKARKHAADLLQELDEIERKLPGSKPALSRRKRS
jgi:transcriptional regulator with XRE-family HTH domain